MDDEQEEARVCTVCGSGMEVNIPRDSLKIFDEDCQDIRRGLQSGGVGVNELVSCVVDNK